MRVLSLFDGISCARVALGDKVTAYYASEVDANAMKVAKKNYPDTQHIGDVREVKGVDYPNIDLLIGGSPCQDLSIAKKGRKGLEGDRSGLFWEYVRVLREVKPKWFILENVASMPVADKAVITRELGVEPIMLNAALVSAQNRKRLFWTNIPNVEQPADRGILLKDILQPDAEVDESMTVNGKSFCLTASYHKVGAGEAEYEHNKKKGQRTMVKADGAAIRGRQKEGEWVNTLDVREDEKANALTQSHSGKLSLVKIGHLSSTDSQGNRVYDPEGKSATLSANGGGLGAKTGLYIIGRDIGRRLNEEGKREDDNKDIPTQRRIEVRTDDKCGTLTSVLKDNLVVSEPRIRKLTPIECERLQGLPDNYTEGIAKTNRYKCLGNAFNVDVVRHILSHLPANPFMEGLK